MIGRRVESASFLFDRRSHSPSQFRRRLGVARYRAGNWSEALDALDKSTELRPGWDNFNWFFLAMGHWQLGNKDEAQTWSAKGVEWMEQNQSQNEEWKRFRSEMEELLK